jgi:aspartyl-tRNA(Asn)/glutamyl-tRNA(Gln) amidotransferase subunit C
VVVSFCLVISDDDLRHLMSLARLALKDTETQSVKADLNAILGYFEQLSELDTEGVEELARPIHTENVYREDCLIPPLDRSVALKVGVELEGGFFKVPRTVEEQ